MRTNLSVAVVHGKVGYDDRYGQGNGEYAGESAQRTDEHADISLGRHITVADGCHGDQSPPQTERDAIEVVVWIGLNALGVVDERGKYDDAQDQEEDEERQFFGRRTERLYEDFQSGRVTCQLEQSHDTDDGEELENVGVLQVGGKLLQRQVDEERQRGHVVDDIDAGAHEEQFIRTRDEAHQDLDGEPRVAHGFDVEEGFVRVCLRFVQRPRRRIVRRVHRHVPDHRHSHVRVCFQAE